MRRSWRVFFVLMVLGLLTSLTVGTALARDPGNGQGKGSGQNPKGRPVHAQGTVKSFASDKLVVTPRKGGADVIFNVTTTTRIVGEGTTATSKPTPKVGDRVNVVGRKVGADNVASVIVIQGKKDATATPAQGKSGDQDNDDDAAKDNGKAGGKNKKK